jgi:hypothetical protein
LKFCAVITIYACVIKKFTELNIFFYLTELFT